MQNCLQMIFAFLFLVIHDVDILANELNKRIVLSDRMSFNPHPRKQAQEITFSRKTKKIAHLSLRFNNSIAFSHKLHIKNIFLAARLAR